MTQSTYTCPSTQSQQIEKSPYAVFLEKEGLPFPDLADTGAASTDIATPGDESAAAITAPKADGAATEVRTLVDGLGL